MHELPGHTLVFERRHQSDAVVEYPLWCRAKQAPATGAEKPPANGMTALAEHVGDRTVPQWTFSYYHLERTNENPIGR